jgi:hypothetical protein
LIAAMRPSVTMIVDGPRAGNAASVMTRPALMAMVSAEAGAALVPDKMALAPIKITEKIVFIVMALSPSPILAEPNAAFDE